MKNKIKGAKMKKIAEKILIYFFVGVLVIYAVMLGLVIINLPYLQ